MSAPYISTAETHSGAVVFLGDRAYKLKKPVDLGFLDFSSRQAREQACHREVELNRRLAPDVYLGVVDMHDPDGQPCEHAVVMRRMPDERRLARRARRGPEAPRRHHRRDRPDRRRVPLGSAAVRGDSPPRAAGMRSAGGGSSTSTTSSRSGETSSTTTWSPRSSAAPATSSQAGRSCSIAGSPRAGSSTGTGPARR